MGIRGSPEEKAIVNQRNLALLEKKRKKEKGNECQRVEQRQFQASECVVAIVGARGPLQG